jgi:hypothetical protein
MSSEHDFCCLFLNLFGCSFEEESVSKEDGHPPDPPYTEQVALSGEGDG